jgi:hypothetical protein
MGEATAICQTDSKWSSAEPTCVIGMCVFDWFIYAGRQNTSIVSFQIGG